MKPVQYAYRELIANRRNQIPFWILIGFLPTFVIERTIVDNYPGLYLQVKGTHVHHFTYGIFVLSITGFLSLISSKPWRRWLAVCYGVGVGLAFDEFGMWLHLTSNYNIGDSEYAMVGILVFLVAVVYGIGIMRRAMPYIRRAKRS